MERDQSVLEAPILTLPIELLIIIGTYLSSRDRFKLRYVSRGLRVVSETSPVWREFVWDYYDTREELCVKNVLKRCGEHIKRLTFLGYLTPNLDEILQYCSNVRHVRLPVVMTLSPDQLGRAIQQLEHLRKLDIGWDDYEIKPLLLITSKLTELTLCLGELRIQSFSVWVSEWVDMGFRPENLNIIFNTKFNLSPDAQDLAQNWQQWNSQMPFSNTANVKFYERYRIPLNLYPTVPAFQLEFGQTAVCPFALAKQCGIQGLDYLAVADCCRAGRMVYKATITSLKGLQFNTTITSLHFVTHFNVAQFDSLLPSHLEDIAIACPNLQQLMLPRCSQCLKSLQGLRAIARHCHKLQGLNIMSIPVTELESQIQLWEILISFKLTHLIADFCVISPHVAGDEYKENMICLYQKCSSLVAIESSTSINCKGCRGLLDNKNLLVLCEFPSLRYLKLFNYYFTSIQEIITSCKEVKCFILHSTVFNIHTVSFSFASNSNLQQLCISSRNSDVADTFMSSVSAHGGLVHVFLSVASVSVVGLSVLIENSPKLMTFYSVLEIRHENSKERLTVDEFLEFECILKQQYRNQKVFNVGGFKILQKDRQDSRTQSLKMPFKELGYTDLLQIQ